MKKKEIILIGGGDHCSSCIDVIEQQGTFRIKGIIDKKEKIGQRVLGYPIIGEDSSIKNLSLKYSCFFITIGHLLSPERRIRIYKLLKSLNITIPVIISPLAYVSKHSVIGEGTIVMPFSVIDVNVVIGSNCIINHMSTIGHEASIENHCHVSANCVLGKCKIGEGSFIGGNSWITNSISIAPYTVIGSGSNVLSTIEKAGVYAGNPSRLIRLNE